MTEAAELILRMRRLIDCSEFDSGCRQKMADMLARFADLEQCRTHRARLAMARECRHRIAVLLSFLSELDDAGEFENDRSVFLELALLFDDIAASAESGALALRSMTEDGMG